ncbi:hypothetical protein JHK85_025426 [Glycine max]|nr:hypothetical protein JHK85_025426 [Glycine max]
MSWSHRLTSTTLSSLLQADNGSFCKFMDRFGRLVVQIRNLNLEVTLHSMLLALQPEAFNVEIPIKLPAIHPPRPRLDKTKHCRCHHNHGHNTEDCWALKDKIEELIYVGYLAQFVKKSDDNQIGGMFRGHQDDHQKSQNADRRRDQMEDRVR